MVALFLGVLLGQLSIVPPALAEFLINSLDRKPLEKTKIISTFLNWFPQFQFSLNTDDDYFRCVVAIGLILPLYFLIFGVVKYFHYYLIKFISEKVVANIRLQLMKKLMDMDPYFYQKSGISSGGLISKTLNDTMVLQQGLVFYGDLFREPIIAICLVTWMFYLNWQMAAVCFLFLPVFAIVIGKVVKGLRKYSHQSQEALEELTASFKESLDGVRVIQSYNLQEKTKNKFSMLVDKYLHKRGKIIKRDELASPINEFFASALLGGICVFQAYLIFSEQSSIGSFAGFLWAAGLMGTPVKKTQTAIIKIQQNIVALERLYEIFDAKNTIFDKPGSKEFNSNWQQIQYKDVSFAYGKERVLDDVSFTVNRGETIAFVGESGSGKTTLVNLLERFFDPTEGEIAIDGLSISDIKISSLRQNIALVTQEVFLFDETVESNITDGNLVRKNGNVKKALEMANAIHFVEKLPDGLQTGVGERGQNFSGGEKQRLSLARAFYKDAPILILDEATSSLDSVSEQEVQKGINDLIKGRTAFVIAHRLSTVKDVDKIIVMKKGKIVETGSHTELQAKGGYYSELFKAQT